MPVIANKKFRIDLASDLMIATLLVNGKELPGKTPVSEIEEEVKALKIKLAEEGRQRIAEFAAALAEGVMPEPVVIARGKPPVNDTNGKIEKLFLETAVGTDDPKNTTSQSHYDRTDIITAEKDLPLIKFIPPQKGEDGIDVFGNAVPRKLGREVQLRAGSNTRREGDMILADAVGKIEMNSEKIWVDTKLSIRGNVDFSSGNIDFSGDVEIQKNVVDLFKVKSSGEVKVFGVIEAAEIQAGGDLLALGGIAGKEKGQFSAGKNIKAKYITNASVRAGGDIHVHMEVVQSDVVCGGRITVETGPVVGGRVVAVGGLKLRHLGSDVGTKTIVEAGIDERIRQKLEEVEPAIKIKRRKAEKVRQVVEPLLQNQKHLNQEQKEKATELLFTASELEEEAVALIAELRKTYENGREIAVPEVEVTGKVFSGTMIRFPRVDAMVTMDLNGPLKIIPENQNGVMRAVAKDINTGASHVLQIAVNLDDMWERLENILGEL